MNEEKYNKNNNLIYYKDSYGEYLKEFNENNNKIYNKSSTGYEIWREYDENNNKIKITKEKELKFRKKEKEYLSRKKCSRFEIMDI